MIELFNDLPESVKNTDRAFIDFYFKMKLEERNASNSN